MGKKSGKRDYRGVKEDNDSRYSCQKKCDTQQTDMQNMFFYSD